MALNRNQTVAHVSSKAHPGYDSVIGDSMVISGGTVKSSTNTRINGKVECPVEVSGELYINAKAEVKGKVSAETVVIAGDVTGEITANHVTIEATGHVYGNINTQTIMTNTGGYIDGQINMNLKASGRPETVELNEALSEINVPSNPNFSLAGDVPILNPPEKHTTLYPIF